MADTFMNDNFLLENRYGQRLYHEVAKKLPIIDFHSHLPPGDIAENRGFENLTQIWLEGDHYKWRAMRAFGVDETFISGSASDKDKFLKWAEVVPHTLRNPLYHWTHLELRRYFGIRELLSPKTADKIWEETMEMLQSDAFRARALLEKMNVELIATTDDPADDLKHHQTIASSEGRLKVCPTFRPDALYASGDAKGWKDYTDKLGNAAGRYIQTVNDLLLVLQDRIEFFHNHGCRMADHGLTRISTVAYDKNTIEAVFNKLLNAEVIDESERMAFTVYLLVELGHMYHQKGWVQQLHIGAFRSVNTRMTATAGPNAGFDSVADFQNGSGLAGLLDALDRSNQLPKTILYNLNPSDNTVFATMAGNFNDGSVKGKVQYGPAWWFLDQKSGIEDQLDVLSNTGLLSCFVGMLTDSRSFLSYSRHEYFRRILCNLIGRDVESGELPDDREIIEDLVSGVCYRNAKEWFGL